MASFRAAACLLKWINMRTSSSWFLPNKSWAVKSRRLPRTFWKLKFKKNILYLILTFFKTKQTPDSKFEKHILDACSFILNLINLNKLANIASCLNFVIKLKLKTKKQTKYLILCKKKIIAVKPIQSKKYCQKKISFRLF